MVIAKVLKPVGKYKPGDLVDLIFVGRSSHDFRLRVAPINAPFTTELLESKFMDHFMLNPIEEDRKRVELAEAYEKGLEDGFSLHRAFINGDAGAFQYDARFRRPTRK